MKIILRRSARVHDRMMHAGDELDCPDKEAQLWCALNWAVPKEDGEEDFSSRDKRPNGRYKRRDMRAEE